MQIFKRSCCIISLLIAVLIFFGCAYLHPNKHLSPEGKSLLGYGVVNHWQSIDPKELAGLLTRAGLNLTEIEYVPWFDDQGRKGLSSRTDVAAARHFVNAMRRKGITTLISVVNWNGEAQRAQSDEWYLARILEIKKEIGIKGVLLLPVSEPDSGDAKCRRWQEMAKREWGGPLVANGHVGRGEPLFEGAKYIDWHWCQDFTADDVKPQPYINNTDCGPVLNPGPKRAAAMMRAALDGHANFLIYDWDGEKIDNEVIAALGAEIRRQ